MNENKAQEYDAKRSLVTTQHGNVRFRISCAWISCLSRRMEAIDWRKLVAKREFNNPMDNHAMKVVLGNETVSHLPRRNSMPVRVYLFKHTANETLERTTGEQYSGLEPEDPNNRLLLKAMINKTFQYVYVIH